MTITFKHKVSGPVVHPLPATPMGERNGFDRRDNIAFTWGVPIM